MVRSSGVRRTSDVRSRVQPRGYWNQGRSSKVRGLTPEV